MLHKRLRSKNLSIFQFRFLSARWVNRNTFIQGLVKYSLVLAKQKLLTQQLGGSEQFRKSFGSKTKSLAVDTRGVPKCGRTFHLP